MLKKITFRGREMESGKLVEGSLRQDPDLETTYISGFTYYSDGGGPQREPFEIQVDPDTVEGPYFEEPGKIYTVMVMEKLEETKYGPEFGGYRIAGWYSHKESAMKAVKGNCCDIWETCYEYALIEEVEEGLYNPAGEGQRWWFRFSHDDENYEEIEEPKCAEHFGGFTIG